MRSSARSAGSNLPRSKLRLPPGDARPPDLCDKIYKSKGRSCSSLTPSRDPHVDPLASFGSIDSTGREHRINQGRSDLAWPSPWPARPYGWRADRDLDVAQHSGKVGTRASHSVTLPQSTVASC